MADGLNHPLDLMFAALMDGDFQPGVALGPADLRDFRRGGEAIFKFDAPFECVNLGIVEHAFDLDEIGLRHVVPRVQQRLRQITVIREQHEAFAIEIQPADRKHAHRHATQKILHGRTPFGIVKRRHDVLGLIEDQIDIRLGGAQMLPVDLDVVAIRVDFRAKLFNDVTVDRHPARHNQFFGFAPRRHPGTGNQLLEADFHSNFL